MDALIIVDVQNDFIPGGALAVPEGDRVVPVINSLQERFDIVIATQDWHPADHGSFAANHTERKLFEQIDLNGLPQVLWPVHCVQNTPGAAFVKELNTQRIQFVFRKGTDAGIDSYSGLFDNGKRKSTGLGEYLKARGVEEVFICGLATDYCVKFTALDAKAFGFKTTVIEDACRGVNLRPGDDKKALTELKSAGVKIAQAQSLLSAATQPL